MTYFFLCPSPPRALSHSELGFKPEFLGRVQLAGSVGGLAGVWIYQRFLKEQKISDVLLWTCLASLPPGALLGPEGPERLSAWTTMERRDGAV